MSESVPVHRQTLEDLSFRQKTLLFAAEEANMARLREYWLKQGQQLLPGWIFADICDGVIVVIINFFFQDANTNIHFGLVLESVFGMPIQKLLMTKDVSNDWSTINFGTKPDNYLCEDDWTKSECIRDWSDRTWMADQIFSGVSAMMEDGHLTLTVAYVSEPMATFRRDCLIPPSIYLDPFASAITRTFRMLTAEETIQDFKYHHPTHPVWGGYLNDQVKKIVESKVPEVNRLTTYHHFGPPFYFIPYDKPRSGEEIHTDGEQSLLCEEPGSDGEETWNGYPNALSPGGTPTCSLFGDDDGNDDDMISMETIWNSDELALICHEVMVTGEE